MSTPPPDLAAWLRLLLTPGIGRDLARRLAEAHGGAAGVFGADPASLETDVGPLARRLSSPPAAFETAWKRTIEWLQAAPERRHVLAVDDPRYPPLLREAADPPLLLFCEGLLSLLQRPAIAIVGSRSATPQGRDTAREFANAFAREGFTVVSGLALGIDAAAHEGALGDPGATVAVVGTGLDDTYPPRNASLAERIRQTGLMLSEFPLGTPPRAEHFPMRNRIIAGLSLGTVVVEAALRSGSLITARLAAECGRDVFAVPGSIRAPQARGCHELIRQGATLVECGADVIMDLRRTWGALPTDAPRQSTQMRDNDDDLSQADPVLDALGHEPATLDQLVARTGWPASTLGARLLELELDDRVARLPGGLFQQRTRA